MPVRDNIRELGSLHEPFNNYEQLPSLPEEAAPAPELWGSEGNIEWDAIPNLDLFFSRIYRYYEEKGFWVIVASRLLNLLALGFTVCFSGFLLLFVNWEALRSDCIREDTCDISEVATVKHPLEHGVTFWSGMCIIYLTIFSAYWLWNVAHFIIDLRGLVEISHFVTHKLGISERQIRTVTWPDVAHRIVEVQKSIRLCAVRDLTEHDVVSRIMRKENYLVGMLNKGVLALNVPMAGGRKRFMLTKTLEWNLYRCILDCMFDDRFCIREEFKHDADALQRRFRRMAVCNLLLSPFLLIFLIIYFFLRNAEKFYHHPSSVGARRWSSLAKWKLREFNELPHYINHRLNASHKAAEHYIAQFPSPTLSQFAKFVSFITGSFAALLLFLTLLDDMLLERHFLGRNLVWWAAILGVVLAVSRAFIQEPGTAHDPELAMLELVSHTHYMPRHWRGRAHTREVQEQVEQLFQFKALLFLEEMASILLTPFVLYFSLPACSHAILRFVRDFTVHVEGVGDICSLAAFDFQRHGNPKYGAMGQTMKSARSRQGKMEKSFLSFAATYPHWEPNDTARHMLSSLSSFAALPPQQPGTSYMPSPLGPRLASPLHSPAPHLPFPVGAGGLRPAHASLYGGPEAAGSPSQLLSGSLPTTSRWLSGTLASEQAGSESRVAVQQVLLQSFYEQQSAQSQSQSQHMAGGGRQNGGGGFGGESGHGPWTGAAQGVSGRGSYYDPEAAMPESRHGRPGQLHGQGHGGAADFLAAAPTDHVDESLNGSTFVKLNEMTLLNREKVLTTDEELDALI